MPKGIYIRVSKDASDAERFWMRVNKTDTCWTWAGTKLPNGYGYYYPKDYGGKRVYAHRFSWYLEHGKFPTNDMCHHCDNPPCVRPDHLFDGTAKDNILDALQKGRFNMAGRRLPQYKLSMELAEEIRMKYKTTTLRYRDLAKIYGVAYKTIDQIIGYEVYVPDSGRQDLTRIKTHCVHGHKYTEENTYYKKNGARECRICKRAKSHKYINGRKLY